MTAAVHFRMAGIDRDHSATMSEFEKAVQASSGQQQGPLLDEWTVGSSGATAAHACVVMPR